MSLEDFQKLKLDVVLKFSTGLVEESRFIALTLHHASPSDLLQQREPTKVALLLTLEQADQLAALLAEGRLKAQPNPAA
jgi:hypothetical protein